MEQVEIEKIELKPELLCKVESIARDHGLMIATQQNWYGPMCSLLVGQGDKYVSVQMTNKGPRPIDIIIDHLENGPSDEWVAGHMKKTAKILAIPLSQLTHHLISQSIRWRFVGYVNDQFSGDDNCYPWNPALWCLVSEVIGGIDTHFAQSPDWVKALALKTLRYHRSEGTTILCR